MSIRKIVGIFALVVFGLMFLSWALGWLSVPGQVTSASNVKKQWDFAYSYDESLQTTARQVCSAQKALDVSVGQEESTQRRTQVMAYEQNYARIQAAYNAKLRNAFQAKLVAPSDVPNRAPELGVMLAEVCL